MSLVVVVGVTPWARGCSLPTGSKTAKFDQLQRVAWWLAEKNSQVTTFVGDRLADDYFSHGK
jgi:hypothetical protein